GVRAPNRPGADLRGACRRRRAEFAGADQTTGRRPRAEREFCMTTISETSAATFTSQRSVARELYGRAQQLIAGGVGHDLRHNAIAPTYIDHALGSRKWDVD